MVKLNTYLIFACTTSLVMPYANLTQDKSLNTVIRRDTRSIPVNERSSSKYWVFDSFKNVFTPTIIRDLHKLLVKLPPKKLAVPRNVAHGTIEDIKNNIKRSMISMCRVEKELNYECLCKETFTNVKITQNKDFDSLVTIATEEKAKLIIVSYRCAITVQNWITNFNYPMVDLPSAKPGVKVHSGFYSNYLSNYFNVRNSVIELLDNPKFKDYTLHVTGYSLGAATATISLNDWVSLLRSRNDTRKIEAYAYASPRPGNEGFAQHIASLNVPITRYTNKNDIVTRLPPRSGGFVHAAPEIHERSIGLSKKRSELVVCKQEYDEDPECAYKEKFPISIIEHLLAFNEDMPSPPYC